MTRSKVDKETMKIGNIQFGDHPLFLAPMEDVTDIGFRMLCKRYGASMGIHRVRERRGSRQIGEKHRQQTHHQ